jgi:hypothetical protein
MNGIVMANIVGLGMLVMLGKYRVVVFNTTRKGPDKLVVPIVTRFVQIET